jgi:hypothetical protein
MVGTVLRRGFFRLSGIHSGMHVDERVLVHLSYSLASRVIPYVVSENVGKVTMWACGTPSRRDEEMFVSYVMCSSLG